jgi:hypothetical protein
MAWDLKYSSVKILMHNFIVAAVWVRRSSIMLKIGLMIVAPSILTYLASTYFQSLENVIYIFVLSTAALLVAILSQISEKSKP